MGGGTFQVLQLDQIMSVWHQCWTLIYNMTSCWFLFIDGGLTSFTPHHLKFNIQGYFDHSLTILWSNSLFSLQPFKPDTDFSTNIILYLKYFLSLFNVKWVNLDLYYIIFFLGYKFLTFSKLIILALHDRNPNWFH